MAVFGRKRRKLSSVSVREHGLSEEKILDYIEAELTGNGVHTLGSFREPEVKAETTVAAAPGARHRRSEFLRMLRLSGLDSDVDD